MKGRKTALAAACILLVLAARPDVTYGASGIDTNRTDCSIRFDLSSNYQIKTDAEETESGTSPDYGKDTGYTELQSGPVQVFLYKVADVSAGGKYIEPRTGDTTLYRTIEQELSGVSEDTKAAQWMEMAEDAQIVLAQTELRPDAEQTVTAQSPVIGGLSTGLYLVSAQEVITDEYHYTFTPYLVSLPIYQEDEWIYEEVPVGLKASQNPRYADLEIRKTLRTYNASLGEASFIFRIVAEKDQRTVYQDVVSLTFAGAGTQTRRIAERIPAGAEVTVTEIYSGTGYEAVQGDRVRTVHVGAYDPEVPESLAAVSFTNDYNGGLNGGASVENQFIYTAPESGEGADSQGSWRWEPLRGPAGGSAGRE